jgi:hypothetical protein
LTVRAVPTPDLERQFDRLRSAMRGLAIAVMFTGFAIGTAILYTGGEHTLSVIGLVATGIMFFRVLLTNNSR